MNLNKKVLELEASIDFMRAANVTARMIRHDGGIVPTPKDIELNPNIDMDKLNKIVGQRFESYLWDLLVMEAKRQLSGKSSMAEVKKKAEAKQRIEAEKKAEAATEKKFESRERAEAAAEGEAEAIAQSKKTKTTTKAKTTKKEDAPIPLLREKEAWKKIEEINIIKSKMRGSEGAKRRRRCNVGIICRPSVSNH